MGGNEIGVGAEVEVLLSAQVIPALDRLGDLTRLHRNHVRTELGRVARRLGGEGWGQRGAGEKSEECKCFMSHAGHYAFRLLIRR
jgi:hypothetical protein